MKCAVQKRILNYEGFFFFYHLFTDLLVPQAHVKKRRRGRDCFALPRRLLPDYQVRAELEPKPKPALLRRARVSSPVGAPQSSRHTVLRKQKSVS